MTGTKFGKLESRQWSVVNDLADPRELNPMSAGRTAEELSAIDVPQMLKKWGEWGWKL